MNDYISRGQAQKRLNCTKETMYKLLRSGVLESARKENGGWLVSSKSLEAFIQSTWTENGADELSLQKRIAQLKNCISYLTQLLDENGIPYPDLEPGIVNSLSNTYYVGSAPFNDKSLVDLRLSRRIMYILNNNGILSLNELTSLSFKELLGLKGIGKKSIYQITSKLEKRGLSLKPDVDD